MAFVEEKGKLKIVFAGTPEFSVPFLDFLRQTENVAAVITRPDRPAGRKRNPLPPPVKAYAEKHNLVLLQPGDINSRGTLGELKKISPDIIVVVSYGGLLKKPVLEIPPLGCLNIHPSLLPLYRGPCPVERAIMNGDRATGVCSIIMDEGMDSGKIVSRKEVGIDMDDNRAALLEKLIPAGTEILKESLEKLKSGSAVPVPQEGKPVYAPFIEKPETEIDWNNPAVKIHNLVRALNPYPGARTAVAGSGERVIIWETSLPGKPSPGGMPGEIREISKAAAAVACGTGAIAVKTVQPEGGKIQNIADFLRGRKAAGFQGARPQPPGGRAANPGSRVDLTPGP